MIIPASYIEYLDHIGDHMGITGSEGKSKNRVTELITLVRPGLQEIMPATYILDLTSRKYVFIDKRMQAITGYVNGHLHEGGTEFGLTLWDKNDLSIFSNSIFAENLNILRTIPVERHSQLTFQFNYRIFSRTGEQRNILQRSKYISDPQTGLPVCSIGSLSDISLIRNDGFISHSITDERSDGSQQIIHQRNYFAGSYFSLLTKREVEIVKLICEGLDTRSIADKIYVSINTVNNHRRNITAKTGCKNALELFKYAVKHQLF